MSDEELVRSLERHVEFIAVVGEFAFIMGFDVRAVANASVKKAFGFSSGSKERQ